MYNIYIIGQPIMLADISSRRSSNLCDRQIAVDARPSPPHFYCITDRLLFLYLFMFYSLLKPSRLD